MKRLILAISLIVTTIVIALISLAAVEKANEKMVDRLDEITKHAMEGSYNLLNESVGEAISQWEEEKPVLNILIGQQQTNEITGTLRMIEHFAREGNKESILLYIYECKTELEKIKITNEPSLSTIL